MTNVAPNPTPLRPPAPPPPPPPSSSFPTYPPPAYAPYAQPPARVANGQSITALVLGCCALFLWPVFVLQALAIVFASIAMSAQRRAGQTVSGMAIAGLVLGILFTVIALMYWVAI